MLLYSTLISLFLFANGSHLNTSISSSSKKFHFVLVHGAGHGAWCWYKITNKLQEKGHTVDAVDLTSASIDKVHAAQVRTLFNYTYPLIQLIKGLPKNDKVVLVGHSLGGMNLNYMLQNFPGKISAAIYLTAIMLPSGSEGAQLYKQVLGNASPNLHLIYAAPTSTPVAASFKIGLVQELLYGLSPRQDVVLAKSLLSPFPVFDDPTVNLTSSNFGSVPRCYIKTKYDKILKPDFQALVISKLPPKRVVEISSDHSPFFSRPEMLVKEILAFTKAECK